MRKSNGRNTSTDPSSPTGSGVPARNRVERDVDAGPRHAAGNRHAVEGERIVGRGVDVLWNSSGPGTVNRGGVLKPPARMMSV